MSPEQAVQEHRGSRRIDRDLDCRHHCGHHSGSSFFDGHTNDLLLSRLHRNLVILPGFCSMPYSRRQNLVALEANCHELVDGACQVLALESDALEFERAAKV
jgi:hypothetical protein